MPQKEKKKEKEEKEKETEQETKPQSRSGTITKDFLNPKSMLTPGIAGGLTLLFTSVLAAQFGLKPNYTGLAISCFFAAIIFLLTTGDVLLRGLFWVLNSLMVFSIALGTNQIGVGLASKSPNRPVSPISLNSGTNNIIFNNADLTLLPKSALFANWLDGTIPRRTDLLNKIKGWNNAQAVMALTNLGVTVEGKQFAKDMLEKWIGGSRNIETVATFEHSVDKVQ